MSSNAKRRVEEELEVSGKAEDNSSTKDANQEPQIDYTTLELDSDNESADETEIPEGSLFDYHVPGILTVEEVKKLKLEEWRLRVRNDFVEMKALRGWESSKVTDPQSLKGIVAELAAALGPEVVKGGSAVNLF